MAKTELQRRLEALNNKFKNAHPAHGFRDLPGGEYPCKIVSATLGMSKGNDKNPPAPQVVWEYKVTEGDCAGRTFRRYINLESIDKNEVTGVDRVLGDLETLGIDVPDDQANLGPALEKVIGMTVVMKARPVDERTYYDLVDLLDGKAEKAQTDDDPAAEEHDDPEPAPAKKSSGNNPLKGLSRLKLRDMTDKEVAKIADVLEINPDDYDGNMKKVRAAICEELGL
jgi:hypothetical protein